MTHAAPAWITRLLGVLADGDPSARIAETHISWVLLAGEFAWKIKKPLKLPFLDFSSLELRFKACNDELRLNQRFAPELYMEVLPISGTTEAPRLGGGGSPFEYAVKMRRFNETLQLDHLVRQDLLEAAELRQFGAALAMTHAMLPRVDPASQFGVADAVLGDALDCLSDLRQPPADALVLGGCDELEQRLLHDGATAWRQAISQRRLEHVRECHGDLHLGNLVRLRRGVVPFDCIEFSQRLRWIDVLSDVAFLVMDLCQRRHAPLAYAFLNAYLEGGGDYDGVRVLRFYLCYRALVRARVALIRQRSAPEAGPGECHSYLGQALRWARPARPALLLMHGLSGSGKTRCSAQLMCRLPAIRLRSDVERKRMHNLAASVGSGSAIEDGIYTPQATEALYRRLAELAATILQSGESVIVDAAFLHGAERRRFAGLARSLGTPLVIVSCSAPQEELERRLIQRQAAGGDASEADVTVLRRQLERQEPLDAAEHERTVTVESALPELDPGALARLDALLQSGAALSPP